MRIIPAIICLLLSYIPHFAKAAFTENTSINSDVISTTASESYLLYQSQNFALLNRKEYEQLTGQHLGLAGRVIYQLQRTRLQRTLKNAVALGINPSELFYQYLAPLEKRSNNTGRTIAIVLLTIIFLFLLLLLIVFSKLK